MLTRKVYTSERVSLFHDFDPEDLGFFLSSNQFGGEDYFFKLGVCNGYFGIGDVTWWDGRVLNNLTDVDYFSLLYMLDRNKKMKKNRDEFIPKAAKILKIDDVYLYRTSNEIIMQMISMTEDRMKEYFEELKLTKWSCDVGLLKLVPHVKPVEEKTPEQIIQEALEYFYEEGSSGGGGKNEEYLLYLKLKRKYEK